MWASRRIFELMGVLGCLPILALTAGTAAANETTPGRLSLVGPSLDHRQEVPKRAEVEIRVDRGTIQLKTGQAGVVHVRGSLGSGVDHLELRRDGRWLRLAVIPQKAPPGTILELTSDLELTIPVDSDLQIEGPAVDLEIGGRLGKVDLRTLTGEVRIGQGEIAELKVQTISGAISTRDLKSPRADLRSAAGAIHLGGVFEELAVHSAESPIEVNAAVSDEVLLESSQGQVLFAGELGPVARLRVHTQGGEARLVLPAGLEGHFTFSSFEGELENRLAAGAEGATVGFAGQGLRRQQSYTHGTAARRVEVETFDGKISLLPR